METKHQEKTLPNFIPTQPLEFRHTRDSLSYQDMHDIRGEIIEFVKNKNISKDKTGDLLLIATEILTNLIKHPIEKPDHIEIKISFTDDDIILEILDNGSHFANFDAKCDIALSMLNAIERMTEGGYGLGCILSSSKSIYYTPASKTTNNLNKFKTVQSKNPTPSDKNMSEEISSKKKIFLIDDDPISLKIHHRMLDKEYNVLSFDSAKKALEEFQNYKPDLIISDLTMPEMDGIALREALSKVKDGNITPFIFLSGHSEKASNAHINHLGVDDFLTKPVKKEHLHTVLKRLLRRSEQVRNSLQGDFHRDITEMLKPTMPETYKNWHFTTRHIIAEAGGGDFILHNETDTNMMCVLADIMGHGRQAKFFSYAYAGYLRGIFSTHGKKLNSAEFLKNLSYSIDGDPLLESTIMTCQCFQFFPDGLLKISSAGHPPPFLLRKDCLEVIDIKGPLPGLLGETEYDLKSIQLKTGDKIIFMTDGFLETFKDSQFSTHEALKEVENAPHSTIKELADYIWDKFLIRQSNQKNEKDDTTIIIAEYGEK